LVSVSRGDIYWADLGEPEGHAPAKVRPFLVVQVDEITSTAIGTVIGSAITSNLKAQGHRGAVFLPKEASGLPRDSVVKLTELVTVDKWQLEDYVGHLPAEYILQVENALRDVLGL
jgi:mRNA interferase MazF